MIQTLLSRIGWSRMELGARLSVADRTIRRWQSGDSPVPKHVIDWLERVAKAIEKIPPPEK